MLLFFYEFTDIKNFKKTRIIKKAEVKSGPSGRIWSVSYIGVSAPHGASKSNSYVALSWLPGIAKVVTGRLRTWSGSWPIQLAESSTLGEAHEIKGKNDIFIVFVYSDSKWKIFPGSHVGHSHTIK